MPKRPLRPETLYALKDIDNIRRRAKPENQYYDAASRDFSYFLVQARKKLRLIAKSLGVKLKPLWVGDYK